MTREELAVWHRAEAATAAAKAAEKREAIGDMKPGWHMEQAAMLAARADKLARFHREAADLVLSLNVTTAA